MNSALQTQETSFGPMPVKARAAKKATSELKTKSRSTTTKKKNPVGAKNSAHKRKARGKAKASAKAGSRKISPSVIEDNLTRQIVEAPEPVFSTQDLPDQPDLPIQEARLTISEPAATQTPLSTTDVVFEPLSFNDQPEFESITAVESIPAFEFIESVEAEGLQDLELESFNEPKPPAEIVALCAADVTTPLEVAAKIPLTPLARLWKSMASQLTELWNWVQEKFRSHQVRKRLRVCETVSLGEKRFLAVVQVDGEQFLVGGSSSSVSTLAHLERSRDFSDVFQRHCEQDLSRA